jgi:hypothetical protein
LIRNRGAGNVNPGSRNQNISMDQQPLKKPAGSQSTDEIRLSFSLTRRDVLAYNLHFNRGLIYMSIILTILLAPAIIIAIKYPHGDLGMSYMWMAIGVGLALIMSSSSLLAILIQVYYVKNDVVDKAMEYRNYIINNAGIAIYTPKSQLIRSWKEIVKVIESNSGFYLRTSDKAAIIIPYHVIESDSELETFKRLLTAAKSNK